MQAAELTMQPDRRAPDRADALRPVMQAVEQDMVLDAIGLVDETHHRVGDVVDDVFDDLLEEPGGAGSRLAAIERFGRHADRMQRLAPSGQQEVLADDPTQRADILGLVGDIADQVVRCLLYTSRCV